MKLTSAQRNGYREVGRKCQKFELFETAYCIMGGAHFLMPCKVIDIHAKGAKHRYRRVYECEFEDGKRSILRSIDLIWPDQAKFYAERVLTAFSG